MNTCSHRGCKDVAVENRRLCQKHQQLARVNSARRAERCRESGLCRSCNSPRVAGLVHCEKHRERNNALAKAKHLAAGCSLCGPERKDHLAHHHAKLGMCSKCAGPRVSRIYCEVHAAAYASKQLEASKKNYQKWQAQGICPRCRKSPLVEGKSRCVKCLDDASSRMTKIYVARREAGLCAACGESVEPGTRCPCRPPPRTEYAC
jgi:hypothetical protein